MNKIILVIGLLLGVIVGIAGAQHVIQLPTNLINYTPANIPVAAQVGCPTNNGLTGLWITNISGNTTPWNTSIGFLTGNNVMNAPCIISYNTPWFWPFLTFVLMIICDYLVASKTGLDRTKTFIAIAAAFMFIEYVEVISSLTNTSYFFVFAFVFIIAGFLVLLFTQKNE